MSTNRNNWNQQEDEVLQMEVNHSLKVDEPISRAFVRASFRLGRTYSAIKQHYQYPNTKKFNKQGAKDKTAKQVLAAEGVRLWGNVLTIDASKGYKIIIK